MLDVDQLVADCLDAVRDGGASGAVAVKDVVERTVSAPGPIEELVGPLTDTPVFATWFNSPELTILHVVWPPTVDLMPHDHLMWATIGLYGGREDNSFWRTLPDGDLEHRGTKVMRAGDTVALGEDTIHSVANPSREWTGAIHVYGGDFFTTGRRMWPDPSANCVDFDVEVTTAVIEQAAARAKAESSP